MLLLLHRAASAPLRRLLLPTVHPSGLLLQGHLHCGLPASNAKAEEHLVQVLRDRFPRATDIAVVDVSGGCGAMFEVRVEAPDFSGLRMVQQHRMVTEALKKEIRDMHGVRISTGVAAAKA